jgi:nitroreductase
MSLSVDEVNKLKLAPVEGMEPILAHRWSPRSFKETPVAAHDLKLILEAARWAASSSNAQPWRYLVGVRGSETHAKIFSALAEANQAWAGKPGVLILSFAEAKGPKGNPNRYALYDLGQSTVTMITQATALGLATHSMGGIDHEIAKTEFGLTDDHTIGAVIAIGYQDAPDALPNDQLKEREVAPRTRKPLGEIALTALDTPLTF